MALAHPNETPNGRGAALDSQLSRSVPRPRLPSMGPGVGPHDDLSPSAFFPAHSVFVCLYSAQRNSVSRGWHCWAGPTSSPFEVTASGRQLGRRTRRITDLVLGFYFRELRLFHDLIDSGIERHQLQHLPDGPRPLADQPQTGLISSTILPEKVPVVSPSYVSPS